MQKSADMSCYGMGGGASAQWPAALFNARVIVLRAECSSSSHIKKALHYSAVCCRAGRLKTSSICMSLSACFFHNIGFTLHENQYDEPEVAQHVTST